MNVIMIPPNLEHVTKIVLDEKPPVMYADTIAGLDPELCKKYFDIWHSVGCKIVVKASFIDDAKIAADAGADVMIVKGWEGGGHVTFEATTVLVPKAVDLLDIPVIASSEFQAIVFRHHSLTIHRLPAAEAGLQPAPPADRFP